MPKPSSALESAVFLRACVLSAPKMGKTQLLSTLPGLGYIINSDSPGDLEPAKRAGANFEWDYCDGTNPQEIEKCIAAARDGVAKGTYQWVAWDTITRYSNRAEMVFARPTMNAAGEADGRRYHPPFQRHVMGVVDRLMALPCHVIFNSHYEESTSAPLPGQMKKNGTGIVPGLPGKLRRDFASAVPNIVMYQLTEKGERILSVSPAGIWGLGVRHVEGVDHIPANLTQLWNLISKPSKRGK